MSISARAIPEQLAEAVRVEGRTVLVTLIGGRQLSFSADKFDRLRGASPAQLREVTIFGRGRGLRWEELDEDLSVSGLVRDGP